MNSISISTDRSPRSSVRFALLICLLGAAAAPAMSLENGDLAGTHWKLSGAARARIAGTKSVQSAGGSLTFNADGTCLAGVNVPGLPLPNDTSCGSQLCLPCTWGVGEGRQFSVDIDNAAANAAIDNALAGAGVPTGAVDVNLTTDSWHGMLKKNADQIQIKGAIKAEITNNGSVPGFELPAGSKNVALKLNLIGTPAP